MENKHKHLEFIQNIISRMSQNIFLFRELSITLITVIAAVITVLLALTKLDNFKYVICYFLLYPFIFWFLEGYFLSQERLYRDLYDDVRKLKDEEIDFSMDTSKYKKNKKNSLINSMLSSPLLVYYAFLIVLISAVIFVA